MIATTQLSLINLPHSQLFINQYVCHLKFFLWLNGFFSYVLSHESVTIALGNSMKSKSYIITLQSWHMGSDIRFKI